MTQQPQPANGPCPVHAVSPTGALARGRVFLAVGCSLFALASRPAAAPTEAPQISATHVTVRSEPGRFFGWPANGGIWSWGDEILVQYDHGEYKERPPGSHAIDWDKPIVIEQSRSLDGGLTWSHEPTAIRNTENVTVDFEAPALAEPIDFSGPDTILKFEWAGHLYYSKNRGRAWAGPFQLPVFDMVSLQLRTDYLIEDEDTCLAFWSMTRERYRRAENGDMVYLVRTDDGGLNWRIVSRVSRVVEPTARRHDVAIMPATVRVDEETLVTCIRNLTAYPKEGSIDCRISRDNGATWQLQSTPVGNEAGTTPPALNRLADGRLVLSYGYRKPLGGPTSIRARLSGDNGKSWGEEIILRHGGGGEDIGYARNAVRPDGKAVTVYYWNLDHKSTRDIAATIWDPTAAATAASR